MNKSILDLRYVFILIAGGVFFASGVGCGSSGSGNAGSGGAGGSAGTSGSAGNTGTGGVTASGGAGGGNAGGGGSTGMAGTTGNGGRGGASCTDAPPVPCPQGLICDYDTPGRCAAGFVQGHCLVLPTTCATVYDPVCGCDDQTYSNECERQRARVQLNHAGICDR